MEFTIQSIGVIRTPFTSPGETPIQAARSEAEGWVEVLTEFAPGLQGIEGFSHLHLLYLFDRAAETRLLVRPFLDDRDHGVYTTRHPFRPNHIGMSIVELLEREGNRLRVRGVDMLDGTPLLDIKPYMTAFDRRENVRIRLVRAEKVRVEGVAGRLMEK